MALRCLPGVPRSYFAHQQPSGGSRVHRDMNGTINQRQPDSRVANMEDNDNGGCVVTTDNDEHDVNDDSRIMSKQTYKQHMLLINPLCYDSTDVRR